MKPVKRALPRYCRLFIFRIIWGRLMPVDRLQDHLAYPPRGLRSSRAAAYLGMSESSFLSLVDEGRLPKPKRVRGMMIWDRLELDAAFETLEQPKKQRNTMDELMGLDDEHDGQKD